MYYSIKHITAFHYSEPITESVMELRMQPRSEGTQRCLHFRVSLHPRAPISVYWDYLGNAVHHFDIPDRHQRLTITAQAVVTKQSELLPPLRLEADAWTALDALAAHPDYFDMLRPSHYAYPSNLLTELAQELRVERRDDPMSLLRELTEALYHTFSYVPTSTNVDSLIDDVLRKRQGVCQDYAHVMIALVRSLGIPCRYVSGYLFHQHSDNSAPDATHAWVEARLPGLGWVGFDPTNNLICSERHILVAYGRDYADVPPTRGVFRGDTESELEVAVEVSLIDELPTDKELAVAASNANAQWTHDTYSQIQQQQQQQQ